MDIVGFFNSVDNYMYFPVLVIILAAAGLFFTFRTRGVQIRLFGTACKLIVEKPANAQKVSSFQALMVSTASRVGTGNIVGVSSAICLGGPGACFWMWLMCIIGASSAFIESTLAQIYKQKDKNGTSFHAISSFSFFADLFCANALQSGSVASIVSEAPSSEKARIRPLCASTTALATERPRPNPPAAELREASAR